MPRRAGKITRRPGSRSSSPCRLLRTAPIEARCPNVTRGGAALRPGTWRRRTGQGREHGRHRRLDRLVFPDADHVPAGRRQRGVRGPVALDIPAQLGFPVPDVVSGLGAMLGTGMPEAAVYEDGDPACRERDVGPDSLAARQIKPVILAEPVPPPMQRPPQREFRLGVGAPIGAHVGGAAFAGRKGVLGHAFQGRARPPGAARDRPVSRRMVARRMVPRRKIVHNTLCRQRFLHYFWPGGGGRVVVAGWWWPGGGRAAVAGWWWPGGGRAAVAGWWWPGGGGRVAVAGRRWPGGGGRVAVAGWRWPGGGGRAVVAGWRWPGGAG